MTLSEAEVQVLATLWGATEGNRAHGEAGLTAAGAVYADYLEDWSGAFAALLSKGLTAGDSRGYRLTESGAPLAKAYHQERPDRYWYHYQRLYQAAHASAAHSRFCEGVYGADHCQEGLVDMAALDDLLARLGLGPGQRLLDLGCGAGVLSEFISDQTGAHVAGLDYATAAVAAALERTGAKRANLDFRQGDMNDLDLPPASFDAVIALDTLYWVQDLGETLRQTAALVKPGGRIAIFSVQYQKEDAPPEILTAAGSEVGQALAALGLDFESVDYTSANEAFWRRAKEVGEALKADFEAEGNGFIIDNWLTEADREFLPAFEENRMTRHLFLVAVG